MEKKKKIPIPFGERKKKYWKSIAIGLVAHSSPELHCLLVEVNQDIPAMQQNGYI